MIGQKGIPCTGGGIERNVEDLSVNIAALGHDVIAYTRPHYTDPARISYRGVTLVSLPSIHSKHLDAIVHTLICTFHAIIIQKVDIIHYHGVGPGLCAFIPRILAPHIRVVGTFHSEDWKHQKWSWFARLMLRMGAFMMAKCAHITIAISHAIQKRIERTTGKQAVYVPYGVNVRATTPSIRSLHPFGLNPRTPYILVASRFVRHKGIHEAIRAFIRLKESVAPSSKLNALKLVLAGGGAFTDSYLRELKRIAKGSKDIIFTGFQNGKTLDALFAHAALFISPSITEGRSIALLEALAWGTPVAVADITETREFMGSTDIKTRIGIRFRAHHLPSMIDAMRYAATRRSQARCMGQRGKDFVASHYEWKKVAKTIDDLYVRIATVPQQQSNVAIATEY